MPAAVRKLGNSSGVIIPKALLAEAGVAIGDAIDMKSEEGRIVLSPVQRRTRAGWAEASTRLAEAGDDALVWSEFGNIGMKRRSNGWIARSRRTRTITRLRGRVALSGYLGRTEEACEWVARLLEANPLNTIARFKAFGSRFLSPGTLAVWVEGLRRAGLPEE